MRKRRPRWRRARPTACSRSPRAATRNAPCHSTRFCPPFVRSPARPTFLGHQPCAGSCAKPGATGTLPAGSWLPEVLDEGARARRGHSQRLASPSSTPPALPTPPCAVFMPSSRPACRALAPRPVHSFGASGVGVLGFPARQLPTTHPPEGGGGREQADRPAPFPRSARRAPPPIKP